MTAPPFYITTPIYYVNDVPHLGHAYTTMAADTLARFHRMCGHDTRFLTGTDEHGQKIEEVATRRGLTPQALTDEVAPRFAECWHRLGISNDDFIRTTEARHKRVVADLWHRIEARGDLYLASYDGWYCVGCEAFYTESQLLKDDSGAFMCTTHKRPVAWIAKERSWFFRMASYQAALLAHIESHPEFIQPEAYRNEVLSFVRGGLRDLSVSRTSFAWGIPVPSADPEGLSHVMYVWLDALTNYMSALGDIGGPLYQRYWSSAVHLIGKDILRFHAVYWPCFLLSAGLPLPRTIYSHGWWTVRGEKISKSLPATRIDPVKLAEALASPAAEDVSARFSLGVDAMRYYLLREVPLGLDGDFTFESLFNRYNAELANDLGNLINRSLTLIGQAGQLQVTVQRDPELAISGDTAQLVRVASEVVAAAERHFQAIAPSRALEEIWRLVREGNRYVDAMQPWKLAKDPAARAREYPNALHHMHAVLWTIARLIAPVMPTAAATLRGWIGDDSGLTWPRVGAFGQQPPLRALVAHTALFPRFDDLRQAEIVGRIVPPEVSASGVAAVASSKSAAPAAPAADAHPGGAPALTFQDFMKAELRVAQIIDAKPVPKAKKLLQLLVDVGEGRHRSVVAGIAEAYSPGQLVGRKVILVANLEPAVIRGVPSEGMILAAGEEGILGLSSIDQDVPVGTRVR
jgi:methionyl-tRNA synthetase